MSEARDVDLFFAGNRQAKKRMDEVDRIVRWGRLAPPFGARAAAGTDMRRDGVLLCDHWAFEPGDTWKRDAWGKTLKQCAPARGATSLHVGNNGEGAGSGHARRAAAAVRGTGQCRHRAPAHPGIPHSLCKRWSQPKSAVDAAARHMEARRWLWALPSGKPRPDYLAHW
eukprot:COSAG01_NODE_10200_length_2223_cov_1.609699_1_plen_169_part_00